MNDEIINNSELLEAWDWESGKPTGVSVTRGESYRLGIPHEGVHLWIVRETRGVVELLFQHRAKNKALYPDCLDITVGGHVVFGQSTGKIEKEAMEEIGLDVDENRLTDLGYCRFEEKTAGYHHREFQHVYLRKDGRLLDRYVFTDGEVIGIYAVPVDFLKRLMIRDEIAEIEGFDGSKLLTRHVSRRDFHPMLFDSRMVEYMNIVTRGAVELVSTGKVTVSMPPL